MVTHPSAAYRKQGTRTATCRDKASPLKARCDSLSPSIHLPAPGHLRESHDSRRPILRQAYARRTGGRQARRVCSMEGQTRRQASRAGRRAGARRGCSLARADGAGIQPLAQVKSRLHVGQLHDIRPQLALRAVPALRVQHDASGVQQNIREVEVQDEHARWHG